MPYISEIHFLTSDAGSEAEFVEVTLAPGEDPADYTVSFYDHTGTLKTTLTAKDPNSGSTSNVITNGEVNLASLVGLPDPDNPDYTIYLLSGTIDGKKLLNGSTSSGAEANYVSLYDINTSDLVVAHGVADNPTRVLSGGVANGETATTTTAGWPPSGQSIQFDAFGGEYLAARSFGNAVTCFDERTRILTPSGERILRDLNVGDLVVTLDRGPKPIRWIGVTKYSSETLAKSERLRPVRISKNAFGPGLPSRTTHLSRQHRLLVFFPDRANSPAVLVPVIKLDVLNGISVHRIPRTVIYRHLMFDHHEIICANGLPTESFLARDTAIAALPEADQKTFEHRSVDIPARAIIERRGQLAKLLSTANAQSNVIRDWRACHLARYSAASA